MHSPNFDGLVIGGGEKTKILRGELNTSYGSLVRFELRAVAYK